MNREEYRENAYDLLYLIRCALTEQIPSTEKVKDMDLSKLYTVASAHSLTALTAYALGSAGINDKAFEEEKYKAIRKSLVLDNERIQVINELERNGIWYVPLKGCVIKDWYPAFWMRQMADNDILCDETKMSDIKTIMEDLGFKTKSFGKSHQDVYNKPPVCNFEMHSSLLEPRHGDILYSYYRKIKDKLIKDDDNRYGYHFSNEDMYIYLITHEYKHFAAAGIGLRSLLDTYVVSKHFGNELDRGYIDKELKKLGILEFEVNNRRLAMKIFSGEELNAEERFLLDKYIFAGTYGNFETRVENADVGDSLSDKINYAAKRVKLPEQTLKEFHPFFYRHKALRPFLYCKRLLSKTVHGSSALKKEISVLLHPRDRQYKKFSSVLRSVAYKISVSPFGSAFKVLYDIFILAEYYLFSFIWDRNAYHPTKAEKKHVAKNVTFIYKSFERQDMAKRLFWSIQKYFPGAKVIIADDSKTPLVIRSRYCKVIQLPFNSGLSKGLHCALDAVTTPYTMKLDDDELLTPLSNIYGQLRFLERHKNIDLTAIQMVTAPILESPKDRAKKYYFFSMSNAPKKLLIPHMTKIDADHIVSGKTPNVFLARTEKYRSIGYDDNIRMIDHHEFFYRAAGNVVCCMDTTAFVFHYHNWFDGHYAKFRNDTNDDAKYIRMKHGDGYYR